jgi:hypothetical protein
VNRVQKFDCECNFMTNVGTCNSGDGLPRKDGVRKPLFDNERLLYEASLGPGYLNIEPSLHSNYPDNFKNSFKEKQLWIHKATGFLVRVPSAMLKIWNIVILTRDRDNSVN